MRIRELGAALLAGSLALGLAAPAALADPAMPVVEPAEQQAEEQPDSTPEATPLAAPVVSVPVDRLGGGSRYETATKISASVFPHGADTVYLARADVFADAIAAGSLTDGPVLLVRQCGPVPGVVISEIDRLDPDQVVALGGAGSVCDDVLDEAAAGRATDRLDGANRFETAALIAERSFPQGADTVYLAEHLESVDALAGGALTDGPILLVRNGSDAIPQRTTEAIETLDPTHVVALGGTGVVTDQALTTAAGGRHTARVSGKDRYATSVAIAERAFPGSSSRTYLANGVSAADAVAGGALTRGPILLVPGSCRVISEPVWRRLSTQPPDKLVALGGKGAVCTEQLQTGGRLGVFSGMEASDTARLYDLLTKELSVSPLRYVPPDLVTWRGTSHRVRPEVDVMLEALFDGADSAGRGGLYVTSAFRSYETQQATYDYWVSVYGEEVASMLSAKAGHSEHQLGLAVDIAGPTCGGNCFGTSPEGKWVAANAHRYGFIIRYPEGGTPVTGYYYEPWHLRYVGPRAAWMMHVRDKIYWDTYQPVAVADGTF